MAAWLGRRDRADAAFVVVAIVAAAVILRLGLGLTFFADEWAFIESRSLGDPATAPGSVAAIPPEVGAEALRRLREGAPIPLPEEPLTP